MTAHINIGSNIGDRRALIERAAAEVASLSLTPPRRSQMVESEPWGYESANPYLNLGMEISTHLAPPELLEQLQRIERTISAAPHRTESGAYADRPIDIDLICMADRVEHTPLLTLPHPRMHLRPFVLRPLAELSPNWIHPLLHKTAVRMLADLGEKA